MSVLAQVCSSGSGPYQVLSPCDYGTSASLVSITKMTQFVTGVDRQATCAGHRGLALQALTAVIERSKETTMMGIERELKDAAASLERCAITPLMPSPVSPSHKTLCCLEMGGPCLALMTEVMPQVGHAMQ